MRRIALLSTVAFLAACGGSSSTPQAFLRVGNLSPDLGPLDFCVRLNGTTTWSDPVMLTAGATSGLVYDGGALVTGALQVSRYFQYAAGTYDVAVFQKTGGSCASPTATLTGVSLGSGVHKLVAAVGHAASTTAPHALVSFTDETTVTTGNVAIRFANTGILALPAAAPAPLPAIDVGVTTASTGYQVIFSNVAYPATAAQTATVNANGYATVPAASFAGAVQLTVCPTGLTPASGFCQSTNVAAGLITAGSVATAYVIGLAGVPPNSLLCGDNTAPPTAGYNYSLCLTKLP